MDLANKEAKGNSLGSSSRKFRRYNYGQNEQQGQIHLDGLKSKTAGRLARFNIYETIDSPVKRIPLNRLSSSSTSKLDDPEESKRLLVDVPMTIQTGQRSENQLNKLPNLHDDEDPQENQVSLNCDQLFRRRYQNDSNKFANNQKSSNLRSSTADHSISTNPYSEILTPTTPVPTSSSAIEEGTLNNTASDGFGHYQVPSMNANATYSAVIHHNHSIISRGAPNVNDEVNQIIETKRKKTLLLLKSKEAPKASFEITSPVEETSSLQLSPPQLPLQSLLSSSSTALFPKTALIEQRTSSPTALSDYENVNTNTNNLDNEEPYHQKNRSLDKLDREVSLDIDQTTTKDCQENSSVVSPSESQNFNTLSIVSDILGDLSQEDHSIVNQLSQG